MKKYITRILVVTGILGIAYAQAQPAPDQVCINLHERHVAALSERFNHRERPEGQTNLEFVQNALLSDIEEVTENYEIQVFVQQQAEAERVRAKGRTKASIAR